MGPRIGHSISQGFRAANRSWAGIGFFAGVWILIGLFAALAVAPTRVPEALFLPKEQAPQATTPAPGATNPATPAPNAQAPNLFTQLSTTEAPAAPEQDAAAQAAPTPAPPPADNSTAEQDRLISEWFGRAWPVLLLCVLAVMAANLWLFGGQVGYLAKRVTTQQARIAEFWITGTRSFGSLLLGSLVSLLVLGGMLLVSVLIAMAFSALSKTLPAGVLVVLGLILGFAILGGLIWLFVRLSFWFIAIVVDRLGAVAGFKASLRATRGRWWQVAGLGLLVVLISWGAWLPFGLLEWLGHVIGGAASIIFGILGNVLGVAASLYAGFVALASFIRFYEDTKTAQASSPAGRPRFA